MPSIVAENLTVNFPLYGRSTGQTGNAEKSKIIFSKSGKPLGVRALNNVSFSLEAGDRLGLIGRNGSGKTTLLQVISRILPPDDGRVFITGKSTSVINLNLGIQGEASGQENITLRGLAFGYKRDEIEARREEIVQFAQLGEFIDLPVETYSSGMKMRLNFAIATAFTPDILILDEWLSAGDATFRQQAMERMTHFVDKASILVLASHNGDMIRRVCNKALWIEDGAVRQFGPVKGVVEDYLAESKTPQ